MTTIGPLQQTAQYRSASSANPRFGRITPIGVGEEQVYRVADTFLSLPQIVTGWIKKSKTLSQNKILGTPLTWLAKNFLDHDYKEMPKVPLIGRNVIEPPMGALVVLLFGFTLMGRLKHAIERASTGDYRELGDIFRRDIPTFSIILFALKPLMSAMSKHMLQPTGGIQLMAGGEPMSYSGLKDVHSITHPNRLKFLMAEGKTNRKGVLKAIDEAMKNPMLEHEPTFKPLLRELRSVMKEGWEITRKGANSRLTEDKLLEALEAPAQKAFGIIKKLDKHRADLLLKDAQALESKVSNGFMRKLISKFTARTTSNVPKFSDMFARYAKGNRVWANVVAYGIVVGVLGFGVTALNQWWTEHNYRKELAKAQAAQAKSALGGLSHSHRFAATPGFSGTAAQPNFHTPQYR